ncbi:ParB N-terminal domain-containing protein [Streptomyces californicus]|uniref:ParB N-terminal domain-containing protein n=1 Tax=Streptomyces californicus TaxID=67351 RepID=UPI003797B99A
MTLRSRAQIEGHWAACMYRFCADCSKTASTDDEEDVQMPDAHRDYPTVGHHRFVDGDIGTQDHDSWAIARASVVQGSSARRVADLKKQISENGLWSPVTVFSNPEGHTWVGDGHHRLEALRQLGRSVPVRWQKYDRGHTSDLQGVPPAPGSPTASADTPVPNNTEPYQG